MQAVTTQLAKKRDTAPIVRDYVTQVQRRYRALEQGRLAQFKETIRSWLRARVDADRRSAHGP